MAEGRLTLRDGRTLAWCEYGLPHGRPVLNFHGTPSSRYARHADESVYERNNARLLVFDRPGYGVSTRLPRRGISVVADDAEELLDHLGLDVVHVIGGSGGGPHALALAVRYPERVRAATVVVGAVPIEEEDLPGMVEPNRLAWYAAREGWDAGYKIAVEYRDKILADPLASIRAMMDAAPPSDKVVMEDAGWQRVFVEAVTEALRPGAEGWTDDDRAIELDWDFDPAEVRCSVTWWCGEDDANSPTAAVRRLVARIPNVDLRVWGETGHLESYHRYDEILVELLSR